MLRSGWAAFANKSIGFAALSLCVLPLTASALEIFLTVTVEVDIEDPVEGLEYVGVVCELFDKDGKSVGTSVGSINKVGTPYERVFGSGGQKLVSSFDDGYSGAVDVDFFEPEVSNDGSFDHSIYFWQTGSCYMEMANSGLAPGTAATRSEDNDAIAPVMSGNAPRPAYCQSVAGSQPAIHCLDPDAAIDDTKFTFSRAGD